MRLLRRAATGPIPLHSRALDNLRFIRETMETSASFTAVPGWGFVAIGATAALTAAVAHAQTSREAWFAVWLVESAAALALGVLAMLHKARAAQVEPWSAPARRFAFSFVPPLLAGAALTLAMWGTEAATLIPGMWLLLYGTGVVAAGVFSVRAVPLMGAGFLLSGGAALLTPAALGDFWLALGFGGLHVAFGVWIARRHGG